MNEDAIPQPPHLPTTDLTQFSILLPVGALLILAAQIYSICRPNGRHNHIFVGTAWFVFGLGWPYPLNGILILYGLLHGATYLRQRLLENKAANEEQPT